MRAPVDGVPVLGVVPPVATVIEDAGRRRGAGRAGEAARGDRALPVHFAPLSPAAEACREIGESLRRGRDEHGRAVLLVTGARPGAGPTYVAANVAVALAQAGERTLLVDADARRPSVHAVFGIDREAGFAAILAGVVEWRECVRTVIDLVLGRFGVDGVLASPGLDGLHLIEAGSATTEPSPAAPRALAAFASAVRAAYDVVLIVAPAAGAARETALLAAAADGILLVGRAPDVAPARHALGAAGARLAGLVIESPEDGGGDEARQASAARSVACWRRGVQLTAAVALAVLLVVLALGTWTPGGRVHVVPGPPGEVIQALPASAPSPANLAGPPAPVDVSPAPAGAPGPLPGMAPAGPGGRAGATLYLVMVERLATARDAEALIAFFRRQGVRATSRPTAADPFRVAVGEPLSIGAAVSLAEQLRGGGYQVRLVGRSGQGLQ